MSLFLSLPLDFAVQISCLFNIAFGQLSQFNWAFHRGSLQLSNSWNLRLYCGHFRLQIVNDFLHLLELQIDLILHVFFEKPDALIVLLSDLHESHLLGGRFLLQSFDLPLQSEDLVLLGDGYFRQGLLFVSEKLQ